MILPIFRYGSEVWGLHNAPEIEHLHFLLEVLTECKTATF
jgi:hypothetical protein